MPSLISKPSYIELAHACCSSPSSLLVAHAPQFGQTHTHCRVNPCGCPGGRPTWPCAHHRVPLGAHEGRPYRVIGYDDAVDASGHHDKRVYFNVGATLVVAQKAVQLSLAHIIVSPWAPTRDAPTRSFDRMVPWMWFGITLNVSISMLVERPGSHGDPEYGTGPK